MNEENKRSKKGLLKWFSMKKMKKVSCLSSKSKQNLVPSHKDSVNIILHSHRYFQMSRHTSGPDDETPKWKTYNEEDFEIIKAVLCRGASSKIKLVIVKSVMQVAVLKVLESSKFIEAQNELEMANQSRHNKFINTIIDGFRTQKNFYLLLEWCPFRDLGYITSKVKGMGCDKAVFYGWEILHALSFLHHIHVIHRDVKPENVYVKLSGHVVLGDFGSVLHNSKDTESQAWIGSDVTRPPEVWTRKHYKYSVDIWMFGVTLWSLISNTYPFFHAKKVEQMEAVLHPEKLRYPDVFTESALNLLKKILVATPSDRIKLPEILTHDYFTDVNAMTQPPYSPEELMIICRKDMNEKEINLVENLLVSHPSPEKHTDHNKTPESRVLSPKAKASGVKTPGVRSARTSQISQIIEETSL